nr:cysteine-rich transmembrane protein precursor - Trypanosoma brucei (fragments) [Trypanosoma brucei]
MGNEAGPIFEESNAEVGTPPADAVHDDFFFDYKNATGYADDCNITGDCNETEVSDAADGTDGMFLKSSSSLKLVALCDGCPTEDSPKSSNAKGKGSSVSAGLLLLAGSTFLVLAVGLSAVLFLGRERQNAVVICDNEVMMEEVPGCLSDASFAVPVTQSSDEARP